MHKKRGPTVRWDIHPRVYAEKEKNDKMKQKINPIPINIYNKGKCFLCGQRTVNPDEYLHYVCAIAYEDHKRMKQKELDNAQI